jgi:hypothetical protein
MILGRRAVQEEVVVVGSARVAKNAAQIPTRGVAAKQSRSRAEPVGKVRYALHVGRHDRWDNGQRYTGALLVEIQRGQMHQAETRRGR